MAKKTLIVSQGLKWFASALDTILIPTELGVSKITISGTEITDCTGNRVANCNIDNIKLRVNNLLMVEYNQVELIAGSEPWGMRLLKEFYAQKHLVTMPDEQWFLEFPTPLPKNAKVELIIKQAASLQAGCSSDDQVFTYDIIVEYDDAPKGASLIPYITYDAFIITAQSGHLFHYIKPLPKPLRAVIMLTEDGNSLSASAVDSLTVKDPYKIYWDGAMNELEALQEAKSKKASYVI